MSFFREGRPTWRNAIGGRLRSSRRPTTKAPPLDEEDFPVDEEEETPDGDADVRIQGEKAQSSSVSSTTPDNLKDSIMTNDGSERLLATTGDTIAPPEDVVAAASNAITLTRRPQSPDHVIWLTEEFLKSKETPKGKETYKSDTYMDSDTGRQAKGSLFVEPSIVNCINPKIPAYRFAPPTKTFKAAWSLDERFSYMTSTKKNKGIEEEMVETQVEIVSGHEDACPTIRIRCRLPNEASTQPPSQRVITVANRTLDICFSPGVKTGPGSDYADVHNEVTDPDTAMPDAAPLQAPGLNDHWEISDFNLVKLSDMNETEQDRFEAIKVTILERLGAEWYFPDTEGSMILSDNLYYLTFTTYGGRYNIGMTRNLHQKRLPHFWREYYEGVLEKPDLSKRCQHFMLLLDESDQQRDKSTLLGAVELSRMKKWWADFMVKRWAPYFPLIPSTDRGVQLGLDMDNVRLAANGLFAKYTPDQEADMMDDYESNRSVIFPPVPVSIQTLPFQPWFTSLEEFKIVYKAGVIFEYQFQNKHFEQLGNAGAHRVACVDAWRGDGNNRGDNTKGPKLFYVHVWLNRSLVTHGGNDTKFSIPPIGTSICMDPVDKEDPKSLSEDQNQWKGHIVEYPYNDMVSTRPDFCVLMSKPSKARWMTSRKPSSIIFEILPIARLRIDIDRTTEERQLEAIDLLGGTAEGLESIQAPLIFWREHMMPKEFDATSGGMLARCGRTDTMSGVDRKAIFEQFKQRIIDYRNLKSNRPHMQSHGIFQHLRGGITLETGPTGSGKSRLLGDMVMQAFMLGAPVGVIIVAAEEQEAVKIAQNSVTEALKVAMSLMQDNQEAMKMLSNIHMLPDEAGGLQSRDIIFCTIPAIADLRRHVSKPEFLFVDQATVASVPGSLPAFALQPGHTLMYGDRQQLGPNKSSRGWNPFFKYISASIMDHFESKSVPSIASKIQYRFNEEIRDIIEPIFYPSLGIQCAENTKNESDPIRKAARAVAKGDYNMTVKNDPNKGASAFILDVSRGVAFKKQDSTSQTNNAEAQAGAALAGAYLQQGVAPTDICFVVTYKDQIQSIRDRLKEYSYEGKWRSVLTEEKIKDFGFATVDKAQGMSQPIIILMFVTATLGSFKDAYLESHAKFVYKVTPFIKDAHRLNVSLTRSVHAMVAIMSLRTLTTDIILPTMKDVDDIDSSDATGSQMHAFIDYMIRNKLVAKSKAYHESNEVTRGMTGRDKANLSVSVERADKHHIDTSMNFISKVKDVRKYLIQKEGFMKKKNLGAQKRFVGASKDTPMFPPEVQETYQLRAAEGARMPQGIIEIANTTPKVNVREDKSPVDKRQRR